MKKFLIIGAVLGAVVLALGVAGLVYAQSQTPTPSYPGYGPGMMGGRGSGFGSGMMSGGYGPGMMGGRGGYGLGSRSSGSYGLMHTYMINALAEKLDLTPEDLQTRLAAGETPYQIAQSQGLSDEEIQTLSLAAHDAALAQAVADGVITQAQADGMDQHMEQMWANGFGPGFGACHGWGQ